MKIHSCLGPGYLESVYKNALLFELRRSSISFEVEKPLSVTYEGYVIGEFRADVLVKNILIIELKAVTMLIKLHEVQLVNYLTTTGIDEGLLLNFGAAKLEFRKKFRMYSNASRSTSD